MDTQNIESEVRVWHVPHLTSGENHEYLAYDVIEGPGYRAVELRQLELHWLLSIFPEPPKATGFGPGLRASMFRASAVAINGGDQAIAGAIASLFGNLALPVALALLHLPTRSPLILNFVCDTQESLKHASDHVKELPENLCIKEIPPSLHMESWLEPGAVDTNNFPDVDQWISTLAQLSKLDAMVRTTVIKAPKLPDKKRRRDEEDSGEEEEARVEMATVATEPWSRRLRPRNKVRRLA
jgi:hypothetical protein